MTTDSYSRELRPLTCVQYVCNGLMQALKEDYRKFIHFGTDSH